MNQNLFKVQHNNGIFEAADGFKLYEQSWFPKSEPKAVVIIVHGYAEHSGRYAYVAEYLCGYDYVVETFDLRGHGKSEGKKTYVKSFDEYLKDLDQFLIRTRGKYPEKPIFLFGHSMGGAIVTLYAITRQPKVKGLLLSGAALKISDDISPLMLRLSPIIGFLFPKLPTIKLDSTAVSRDPEVVKWYDNDPLNYRGGVPARTGAEINRATKCIQSQMESIELPLLIMHGTADRLADPEASKKLYSRANSKDKTLKLYEGSYHEILNDPEKARVMDDMMKWLDAHL
ncbi:MAG: alpha/beta hydrolase [Candidatus Marinimicrobia bacterium]|nr:alpha/beta hydrolase [Candidatus Neomarinimicrobiota bacterium]